MQYQSLFRLGRGNIGLPSSVVLYSDKICSATGCNGIKDSTLADYEHIHCFLDNDEAGRKATQAIQKEFCWHVRDSSHLYSEYKDLNDYLCGKKFNQAENRMQQSTQQTQPEKQKQSAKQQQQENKNRQTPGEKRKRGKRL